jgi:CRP/FNR family cyclic AMP-dependent transcriptional regulator
MTTPTSFWPDQIDAHHLLVQVGSGRTTATYRRWQKVYSQGEAAVTVFFVQQGAVELSINEHGVETILGVAKEGQFFGGTCLYDVAVRIASATALTDSRITSVTKAAILAAVRLHPRFGKMFTDHLWYNNAPQKDLLDRLLKLAAATA